MHTVKDCPLRSMAWITINENDKVINATKDMIDLLGFNPTQQCISDIWEKVSLDSSEEYEFVSTGSHMFCVCTHMNPNDKNKTIICTDVTDLEQQMLINSDISHTNTTNDYVMITRLTMYGTIEATYSLKQSVDQYCIGQPMMKYIHSDDVKLFCSSLSKATKFDSITSFYIRLIENEDEDINPLFTQFTVMPLEDEKVLCFIQPVEDLLDQNSSTTTTTESYKCNDYMKSSLVKLQYNFWFAIEHGMTLIAKNLASTLISLLQTIYYMWYKTGDKLVKKNEQIIKDWIKSKKNSTEMDKLCHLVSYFGVSHNTTKNLVDFTLDQTSDWLISKSYPLHYLYSRIL